MKLKLGISILIVAGAGALATLYFYRQPLNAVKPIVYANTYQSPQQFMEGIYAADKNLVVPQNFEIPAVIVPHHLVASESIASGIKILGNQKFKKILLLSPDHFHRCPTLLCTVDGSFETIFGKVASASAIVGALAGSPLVTVSPELFRQEHGIYGILPFIKHYYPDVQVAPLVISQKIAWKNESEQLSALIDSAIDDQTILVVSSDFSHYLNLKDAEQKDEQTAEALFAKDFDGISKLYNADNSDCPNCLWLLAKLADQRGFYNPSVLLHTNSAVILNDLTVKETTSHFSIAWYKNALLSAGDLAVGGDVTITRNMRAPVLPEPVKNWWQGDGLRLVNLEGPIGASCPPQTNIYMFCNLESLWIQIKDLATHWGVYNNHMLDRGQAGIVETKKIISDHDEIAVDSAGWEDSNYRFFTLTSLLNPTAETKTIGISAMANSVIQKLKNSHDEKFKIVLVHGGDEYFSLPTESQKKFWRSLIDAGADAVLVSHSHTVGDLEIYNGKPIFRGIGNFVFDQKDKVATSTAKLVRLRKSGEQISFETLINRIP